MNMNWCWYTKSLSDDSPKKLVHITDYGDKTLCGKDIADNGRWYIGNRIEWERSHGFICFDCEYRLEHYKNKLSA